MPKRFCQCHGCPACNTQTGSHGTLYDADSTGTLKCPGCQQVAAAAKAAAWKQVAARRTRPSAAQRGYGAAWRRISAAVTAGAAACHWCGQPFTTADPATADHVIPKARGGTDDMANLVPAHRSCNGRRGGQMAKRG